MKEKPYRPPEIPKLLLKGEKLPKDILFEHFAWDIFSAYGLSTAYYDNGQITVCELINLF